MRNPQLPLHIPKHPTFLVRDLEVSSDLVRDLQVSSDLGFDLVRSLEVSSRFMEEDFDSGFLSKKNVFLADEDGFLGDESRSGGEEPGSWSVGEESHRQWTTVLLIYSSFSLCCSYGYACVGCILCKTTYGS